MANNPDKILERNKPIKIGNISPLTGDYSYYGELEKRGVDLAVEEINKKGGINGQLVEIVRSDDKGDPIRSAEALTRLIHDQGIQAVIGPISSDALIADAPFAQKNKVTLVSAIASADRTPPGGGYIFKIFPSTMQEGKAIATAAARRGNKSAVIIYINNAYGLGLAKTIKREAPALGIEILGIEGYKKDALDFGNQLWRAKEKNPDAVFLMGFPKDIGLILKQAHKIGLAADFFAPATFENPIVKSIAGSAAGNIVYVMPCDEFPKEFADNFKRKYGEIPNFVEALNYDAVNLLALAIERGGYEGTAIRDELLKIKDYPGASGYITFDETGQAIDRNTVVKVMKDGQSTPF